MSPRKLLYSSLEHSCPLAATRRTEGRPALLSDDMDSVTADSGYCAHMHFCDRYPSSRLPILRAASPPLCVYKSTGNGCAPALRLFSEVKKLLSSYISTIPICFSYTQLHLRSPSKKSSCAKKLAKSLAPNQPTIQLVLLSKTFAYFFFATHTAVAAQTKPNSHTNLTKAEGSHFTVGRRA